VWREASKPLQIEQVQASRAIKDFDPIRRFGHNLKGTGRGYGFPPIETIGRELEKAAAAREASITEQLDNLRRFVSEVDAPILK
jgi:chemotaxis protein histidine kinase CheA